MCKLPSERKARTTSSWNEAEGLSTSLVQSNVVPHGKSAKYFIASQYDSNLVLPVDPSGVCSARRSHKGQCSIIGHMNCQAEACSHEVR